MSIPTSIQRVFPKEHALFLEDFFRYCPKEIYKHFSIQSYPKNHRIISTHDETRYVFFLLKGKLQALEEKVVTIPYQFTQLKPIDIVGDYEVFTQTQGHYVTLTTLEPSLTLQICAKAYIAWMKQDAHALFIRTQMLMEVLNKQSQQQRKFLFMDTHKKLLYFLYEQIITYEDKFPYKLTFTREQICGHIGCSVRQLNRILLQLQKNNSLRVWHGKLYISKQQFEYIKLSIQEYI